MTRVIDKDKVWWKLKMCSFKLCRVHHNHVWCLENLLVHAFLLLTQESSCFPGIHTKTTHVPQRRLRNIYWLSCRWVSRQPIITSKTLLFVWINEEDSFFCPLCFFMGPHNWVQTSVFFFFFAFPQFHVFSFLLLIRHPSNNELQ